MKNLTESTKIENELLKKYKASLYLEEYENNEMFTKNVKAVVTAGHDLANHMIDFIYSYFLSEK